MPYYNTNTFKDLLTNASYSVDKSLSIYHLNAQSLKNKMEHIEGEIETLSHKFDFLAFTETWFSCQEDVIPLAGYENVSQFRVNKRGGGVSLFIKRRLHFDVLNNYSLVTDNFEVVTIRYYNIAIMVVYRPPHSDVDVFFQFVEPFLEFTSQQKMHVVLLGDLNIDIMNVNPTQIRLMEMMLSYGCDNIIDAPTRISCQSETLLDVCFTDFSPCNTNSGVFSSGISDHLPFFALFSCAKVPDTSVFIRKTFDQKNIDKFCLLLSETGMDEVLKTENPSAAYNIFLENTLDAFDKAFPVVEVRKCRKARKEWISGDLLKRIKQKNALFARFLDTRNQDDFKEFKKFRNKLNLDLKKAKSLFYRLKFSSMQNTRSLWQSINKLIGKKQHALPSEMQINGVMYSGVSLANKLNAHFLNVGNCTSYNLPLAVKSVDSFLVPACEHSIFLSPTSEYEILSIINSFRNTCSPGPDGITALAIKAAAKIIALPLAHICNQMLLTGEFPDKMKSARVTVIFKGGNKNDPNNYRPISILPLFSKVAERVIFTRVYKFLHSNNIICKEQYGFQPGKSTQAALLEIKNSLIHNIEHKLYTVGVFLDFSKAFDSIKHDILLHKLYTYGIRGTPHRLLQSYLSNRTQFTRLNDAISDAELIKFGVPQGSILGPLLFTLYINDIVNILSYSSIALYADDSNVFFSGSDLRELERRSNSWLHELMLWLAVNRLELNVKKTKFIIFRPKNKPIDYPIQLQFNNTLIESVNSCKFLGVFFRSDLGWGDHVNHVRLRVARSIGVINRIRYLLPIQAKKQLYFALIHSQLVYCNLIWGTCNKTDTARLLSLQKRALRACSPNPSSGDCLLQSFNVLPFPLCYKLSVAVHIYHKIKQDITSFRNKYVNRNIRYSLRVTSFISSRARTNYGTEHIDNQISAVCNVYPSIIDEAVTCKTTCHFKKKMKMLFMRTTDPSNTCAM